MPTATVNDVKSVTVTDLSDSEITDSLTYAEEKNGQYNDTDIQSTQETKNIERWAAVLNIKQYKERSVSEDSVADSSLSYEGNELQRAKMELRGWLAEAGGDPAMVNDVFRDASRNVVDTT